MEQDFGLELTKRQKKKANKTRQTVRQPNIPNTSLRLKRIEPITTTQNVLFRIYDRYDVLSLHGYPGTGKSFLALYLALRELETSSNRTHIKIVRSSVSVRDAGFLPGTAREKMAPFEAPYIGLVSELYGRGDAYQILKNKGAIEFVSTAHMRGTTLKDCIVIIDEAQNMSYQELNTLMTRFGENCKFIVCGDIYQDDLTSERFNEVSGYRDVLKIFDRIRSCYSINFTIEDIVRSGFVKEYIIAKVHHETTDKNEVEIIDLYEDIRHSVTLNGTCN